jgi:hypothetical protein
MQSRRIEEGDCEYERERVCVCVNVKREREREFVDKSRGERRNYVEHCALNFKVRRGNSTIR